MPHRWVSTARPCRTSGEPGPELSRPHSTISLPAGDLGEDLDEAEALSRRRLLDPTGITGIPWAALCPPSQWGKAEKVLSSVVKEHPEAYEALLHLGMTQAGLGRNEEARSTFRSVIEKSPNQDQVRLAQEELLKL
jgi:hypothetical protein